LKISTLCIVNSQKESYRSINEIILSPFEHLGIPFDILDLSKNKITSNVSEYSVIILGQEGIATDISKDEAYIIANAVKNGTGIVCLDGHEIHSFPEPIKEIFGIVTAPTPTLMPHMTTHAIRTIDNSHYITYTREKELVYFNKPIEAGNIVHASSRCRVLMVLANGSGCPALIATRYGKGKAVLFAVSPKVWLEEYFGHGCGLDDIFWKSIVWASRKPFVMLAMPPFVTMRVDDCSGTYNFKWIDIANRHGIIPHVSLFIDNITDEAAKVIKEKYDNGLAEFSAHAFTWTRQIYWKPKSPTDHSSGEEYPEDVLRKYFRKIDEKVKKWGIRLSKVFVPHFGEAGRNVIPFLKERGIIYLGLPIRFSTPFGEIIKATGGILEKPVNFKPKPYGGKGGAFDYHPEDPELFMVYFTRMTIPKTQLKVKIELGEIRTIEQMYDFLWDAVRVKGKGVDIELAAKHGAEEIKLGLDNLFFGLLITHEQNISILSLDEWDEILTKIDELTSRYDKVYTSWEHIAEYAKNKYSTKLLEVTYDPSSKTIRCVLEGKSDITLWLYLFDDRDDWILYRFQPLPPFKGRYEVTFKFKGLFMESFRGNRIILRP